MQRASKRHNIEMAEQDVDRLSALPDGVLCHILSFMPTYLSVETSVLAKRWRFLWAHVPILDLQDGDYRLPGVSFAGIICLLMLRHKAGSLTTFRLSYSDDDDDDDDHDILKGCYELETCIATAIERSVQNLDLNLEIELPRCVLTCKTLVDLRLTGGVSIPSSGPIYLPSLKKLYFQPPQYDVHFPRLVSGCPVIEELIIFKAACSDLEDCTISSPTLKRFTFSIPVDAYAPMDEFRLKINAPALRYIKVHGVRDWQLSVSLINIIEADILLGPDDRHVLSFLNSICNVKCLKLSGNYYSDEITTPGSIVKFGSLTKFRLTADWCFLTKFLESADNLQELIIDGEDSDGWTDPIEERCACLLHSLRTVRIVDFFCTEQGFSTVRFILKNAQVLERMEIDCRCDLKKKFDALQRISSFRRGSKECELAFS